MRLLLVTVLTIGLASSVTAQPSSGSANCKLTNTTADKGLYEGPCTVEQSSMGDNITVFSIKMGDAEPFKFAGFRGQKAWQHGAEDVQFTDAPKGGIFRWSTFVLVVAQ